MRELQKLIEAIFTLIVGIVLLSALPKETQVMGSMLFGLILSVVIILIIYWIFKNFIEKFI